MAIQFNHETDTIEATEGNLNLPVFSVPDNAAQRTELGLGSGATTNITASTDDPSGGADGDIWIKYTA